MILLQKLPAITFHDLALPHVLFGCRVAEKRLLWCHGSHHFTSSLWIWKATRKPHDAQNLITECPILHIMRPPNVQRWWAIQHLVCSLGQSFVGITLVVSSIVCLTFPCQVVFVYPPEQKHIILWGQNVLYAIRELPRRGSCPPMSPI